MSEDPGFVVFNIQVRIPREKAMIFSFMHGDNLRDLTNACNGEILSVEVENDE